MSKKNRGMRPGRIPFPLDDGQTIFRGFRLMAVKLCL